MSLSLVSGRRVIKSFSLTTTSSGGTNTTTAPAASSDNNTPRRDVCQVHRLAPARVVLRNKLYVPKKLEAATAQGGDVARFPFEQEPCFQRGTA